MGDLFSMTRELYNRAAAEGKNPMHYIYEDLGIKRGCKYFVETGTHLGGSVDVALELGFDKIFSCDFMCCKKFNCLFDVVAQKSCRL